MTVRLGADAESSDIGTLQNLGATFISRYLSDFPSKNLTLAEAQRLSDAGIDVVSNWEDDVNTWAGGYSRGVRDAQTAWAQHKQCGGPDGRPIYFSVDTDVDPNNAVLHDYFRGLGVGMTPGQIGVYGSTGVCNALKAAGLVHWTWRTMSTGWTGGAGLPSMFNVEQTGYFNSNYDRDASITDDFGQWRVGQSPTPTPTPTPVPTPGPLPTVVLANLIDAAHRDPAAPQGVSSHPDDVTPVQQALVLEGLLDPNSGYGHGCFGTLSVAAYAKWQERLGYSGANADGIPGATSLNALAAKHPIFRADTGSGPATPPPATVPVVSLHILQMCANEDPAKPQGQTTNSAMVDPVQQSLEDAGLLDAGNTAWGRGSFGTMTVAAYAKWQESLGYSGSGADGHPGNDSLSKLAAKYHRFTVIA